METKHLDLTLEVKELTAEGKFVGMASMYDVVDLGGDVVKRGAFAKTLAESREIPVLWQHRSGEVIGKGKLSDTPHGLMIEAELDMDDPLAQKAHSKLKKGYMKGLSIGFQTVKDAVTNGIREILEAKLWEVSVVTFPMNPAATVTSVKDLSLSESDGTSGEAAALEPADKKSMEPVFHSILASYKVPTYPA